ncbi:MAG: hypothetical protein CMJ94_13830 [Planctomycetes bacterium]|nr:hypothetical protein [Planctomycetota bacterium]
MLGLRHLPLLALSFAPARCELPGDLRPEPLQEAAALKLPAAALRLPLHADSRWVLARVQIGEREVLAAYDTGLSVRALIDEALCEELELPLERGLWSRDGGGGRGYKRGTTLPKLRWGAFEAESIRALRGDLSFLRADTGEAVQLVLGLPLLGRRTFQLDAAAKELRVYDDAPLPEVGKAGVLAMRRSGGVPFCPIRVGDEHLRLLLDSGFDGALALPDRLRSTLPLRGEAQRTGSVRTVLGPGGAIHTGRLDLDLEFAGYRFPAPGVQFLEGYRHAVLGRRSLDVLIWTIDPVNGRVHFGLPVANAKSASAGILGVLPFSKEEPASPDER